MIAVTGASGHIGNTLVKKLIRKGDKLRILVHEPTHIAQALEGCQCEEVHGDVRDYDSLLRCFTGAKLVYHCAAKISITPGILRELRQVNVEGTENVIRACRELKIPRLVYVSSIEAIGDPNPGCVVDESCGYNPQAAMIEYGITKGEASLKVLEAARNGMDIVTVCPVGVTGPNDYRPSQMGQMFKDFYAGRLPAYPAYGGFDFVDVRDVANGMMLAAENGRSGEHYILTSEHLTMEEMMTCFEGVTGKKKPRFKLPFWLMYFTGYIAEFYYRWTKNEAVLTRGSASIIKTDLRASSAKAMQELGYQPRPLLDTFRDLQSWMKKEKIIP